MKHAILIMAHNEYRHLKHLVEYFNHECYVFIHFDKKGTCTEEEISEAKNWLNVIQVYKKFSVHWGGFSMLKCELFLLREALVKSDADYFHLLSGQDYPIKPLEHFLNHFERNKGHDFVSFVHLPHPQWQNNTYSRFTYFYPFDFFKHGIRYSKIIDKIKSLQNKFHYKRRIPDQFEHLYGGSQWFSLTRESVSMILDYTSRKRSFLNRLKWTFAPEECYIQTVAKNILPKEKIIRSNMRFIRWVFENDNKPSNLGIEHFYLLASSNMLIARKFKNPFSRKLIPAIDKYLLKDNQCQRKSNGTWIYDGYLLYKYDSTFVIGICKYCEWMNFKYILDAGCGSGMLVAAFRRMGYAASGIDSNPYTPELSARLLSDNDIPCEVIDLTEEITADREFDLVLCLDVLQYIPETHLLKVINNLVNLTKSSLIISYTITEGNSLCTINELLKRNIQGMFHYNKGMSMFLQKFATVYQNIMLFERTNLI